MTRAQRVKASKRAGVSSSPPLALARPAPVQAAIEALATQGGPQARGAVFTKPEVVEGILDLCDYHAQADLLAMRLLEPAAGDGAFLLAAVARLLRSCQRLYGPPSRHLEGLRPCIRAVELHRPTFRATASRLTALLVEAGLTPPSASALAGEWLRQDDFLLTAWDGAFDVAVGNPPYVRQERIPTALLNEYKTRFDTLYDRADLYVLFYERCLDLLGPQGVLGFICADRWIKNTYGGPLRQKVAQGYNLDVYMELSGADAFDDQVDAYPAITIIRRAPATSTRVLSPGRAAQAPIGHLFDALRAPSTTATPAFAVSTVHQVGCGRDPWLLDAPQLLETIRALEHTFPTLEEAGAKVGIGVATGADKVYLGAYDALPVERSRLLPLVMSKDLRSTAIAWSGLGLVNPWEDDGSLVRLEDYPQLREYLLAHERALKGRHTAKRHPASWYRTIDRVDPSLSARPKLLIPDIRGEATVVLDEGQYYPHHNLYVITSQTWELRALQAVLRSSVALAFISAYSVRMSGGYLRFQAQYLRRIRAPSWEAMTPKLHQALAQACLSTDQAQLDEVVYAAYGLSPHQARIISGFAASARVTAPRQPRCARS